MSGTQNLRKKQARGGQCVPGSRGFSSDLPPSDMSRVPFSSISLAVRGLRIRVITLVPSSATGVPVKAIHPYVHPFLRLPRDRYSTPHNHHHPDPHLIVPPLLTMSLGLVLPPSQPRYSCYHQRCAFLPPILASFILFNTYSSSTTSDLVQTEKKACDFGFFLTLKPVNETIREDQRRTEGIESRRRG
ncbi:hypothetical protein E1B28_011869 [Marasmius oreades]|uniref:Uncharacterized protein n=1 Tax=Marasmius oreades TaxID=181124 RepID=A0A9P7UQ24_9AGAR|nr:uncharacterized protein E1B28_011869 [Marasmius oreades]KAG7090272.1 hypothetical protein E1B28_011869 [Marasmius oreades]